MTATIDITNLRHTYGETVALDGITTRLEGGKIHGLIGRNGSGKTSLLSAIAAFLKPTAGEVRLDGAPVFENPAAVSQIALIREGGDTVESDNKVKEALRYAAYLRPNWDDDYANRLLERFEVPVKAKLDGLSRGKRSAVGIVLGLASRAPLTIFDETYLGLDAPSRYAFYEEILADYMDNPRTFIISSHLIEEVSSIFEEVIILDQGKVLLQENRDLLLQRGVALTGPAEVVDRHTNGLQVIGERRLGGTSSAMVYGEFDTGRRAAARAAGLQVEPIALQDLFVHLTTPKGTVQ